MGAQHFFKQLLTTLDEALMRDAHPKEPQQTSTLEAPPTSEPEPVADDPSTDTVALTSTKTMIPLDVSGEIYTNYLLLGGIRGVDHTPSSQLLHIRFLRRLPKEMKVLLTYLEGHCIGV